MARDRRRQLVFYPDEEIVEWYDKLRPGTASAKINELLKVAIRLGLQESDNQETFSNRLNELELKLARTSDQAANMQQTMASMKEIMSMTSNLVEKLSNKVNSKDKFGEATSSEDTSKCEGQ